jgi:hypothetical protein
MVKTLNIDSDLLKKAIERSGLKPSFIAEKLGVTRQALNNKINGKTAFRQSEVYVMCDLLRLSEEERIQIFFPEMLG